MLVGGQLFQSVVNAMNYLICVLHWPYEIEAVVYVSCGFARKSDPANRAADRMHWVVNHLDAARMNEADSFIMADARREWLALQIDDARRQDAGVGRVRYGRTSAPTNPIKQAWIRQYHQQQIFITSQNI